jgi:hypothetical protein
VLAALQSAGGSLEGKRAAVLAATGPVGQRVARLLARLGTDVSVGSRGLDRARTAAETLHKHTGQTLTPFATGSPDDLVKGLAGASIVVAAGAAGVTLLSESVRKSLPDLKIAIDLNAVPPLGIEGIKSSDKDAEREGLRLWGALGVGGIKMKIHKRAVLQLFESNNLVLDAEEVLEIGRASS